MASETPNPAPTAPDAPVAADRSPASAEAPPRRRWRLALGVLVAAVLIAVAVPFVLHSLHSVSTDDAYVNGHVTFVAPRVAGQVAEVRVDDNNRVKQGDVLVELDPEPSRVQVAIKEAPLASAQAQVLVAQSVARAQLGQARSLRFKLRQPSRRWTIRWRSCARAWRPWTRPRPA